MPVKIERVVSAVEFPQRVGFWKDFARVCYEGIGDRLDEHGKMPFLFENPDPKTQLFPTEKRLAKKLLDSCSYLDADDHGMVEASLALMLNAHQGEYRDKGQPYSTHLLKATLRLIKKYHIDAITICSDLLHDTVEDTPITLDEIRMNIHPEVAQTVDGLTRIRGRHQRKAIADEVSWLKQIKSLLDNPRVLLIKIGGDRLHNGRTLGGKRGRARRLKIIDETQQIYIPLARRIGLFDEANELDILMLQKTSKEHEAWARKTNKFMKKFFKKIRLRTIEKEIQFIEGMPPIKVVARIPTVADIYRKIGELRQVTAEDMYLLLDIVHKDFQLFEGGDKYNQWGEVAMNIANILNWRSKNYRRSEPLDIIQFTKEIESHLTDSLIAGIVRIPDNLKLKATIYPADVHELEQTSLGYLSTHSTTEQEKVLRGRAFRKWKFLSERLEPILKGEVVTSQLVRQLEPRLPEGTMRVIGINDNGREEYWNLRAGSTVLDYARDIAPTNFNTAVRFDVTTKDGKVYQNVLPSRVLQARDKVHIVFDKTRRRWDPLWIHSFVHDTEGKRIVQRNVLRQLRRLEQEQSQSEADKLKNNILTTGEKRIEDMMTVKPLRIDLARSIDLIQQTLPDMQTREQFVFSVGMGQIPDDDLSEIANRLSEASRKIHVLRVYFDTSRDSQGKSVLSVATGINLLDIGSNAALSYVSLYLDERDERVIPGLVKRLLQNKSCRENGLKSVSASRNFLGAQEEYYYPKKSKLE